MSPSVMSPDNDSCADLSTYRANMRLATNNHTQYNTDFLRSSEKTVRRRE